MPGMGKAHDITFIMLVYYVGLMRPSGLTFHQGWRRYAQLRYYLLALQCFIMTIYVIINDITFIMLVYYVGLMRPSGLTFHQGWRRYAQLRYYLLALQCFMHVARTLWQLT